MATKNSVLLQDTKGLWDPIQCGWSWPKPRRGVPNRLLPVKLEGLWHTALCRFTPFPRKSARKIFPNVQNILVIDSFLSSQKFICLQTVPSNFLCNFNPQKIIQNGIRIGTHRLRIISFACLKNQVTTIRTRHLGQPLAQVPNRQNWMKLRWFPYPMRYIYPSFTIKINQM